MSSAPLVATYLFALAFTTVPALRVTTPPKNTSFRDIVTDHRPPVSGKACREGERWLDACRACLCAAKGVLRCQALPCGGAGGRPAVVDGLVIPPHSAMRAEGAYTDHAFHSKRGAAADAAHQALAASLASDSDSDSGSDSESHERALDDWPETNDPHDNAKAPLAAFTWGEDASTHNAYRAPPVAQLPDPNVAAMCRIWLLNQKRPRARRNGGDYNHGDVTPFWAHAGGLEALGYQIQRAPPVAQLPEPTIDEICRAFIARSGFAAHAIPQPLSSVKDSTVKSAPSALNYENQPFPLPPNFHLYQTSRSPLNLMPQSARPQTPGMVYPPTLPYSYNPYSHLPNIPSRLPLGYQGAPHSFKYSPLGPGFGYHRISLSLIAAPPPSPLPTAPPPSPSPVSSPLHSQPEGSKAAACDEVGGNAAAQHTTKSLPEMIDMRSEDHFKMHPNAFSVPVRRRRSATENERSPENWKRLLLQRKFARPSHHLSAYLPHRILSGQPSQDLGNSRIILPVARK